MNESSPSCRREYTEDTKHTLHFDSFVPDVSPRQPKALPPMAMATWTNPNIWVPNPPRQTRIVSIGIERSSLSREKGLPLPISQPKGHLWRSTPNSRKSTEEEVNCDATADSCSVLSWFLIHEHLCHAFIISSVITYTNRFHES